LDALRYDNSITNNVIVTVIIPTWNRAETIEKAVYSALEQTMPEIEVLVCDDGSTDNTREIIHGIQDERLHWIEGPRGGRPAIPRNRGINMANGEWIAFLDSDDAWMPEKLARQLEVAAEKNVKAVCTNANRFHPEKGIIGSYFKDVREIITFEDLLKKNYVICSSSIIHHSLFKDVIGFPEEEELKAIEDYALWLRVATYSNFVFIADPLILYRDEELDSVRSQVKIKTTFQQKKIVNRNFLQWSLRQRDDYKRFNLLVKRQNRANYRTRVEYPFYELYVKLKQKFFSRSRKIASENIKFSS
jgi:glycosyltransferase involved in cell wall biosynthesis